MCFEDMEEAFTAVLNSEHPEEELFGLSRGLVDERDAILKANPQYDGNLIVLVSLLQIILHFPFRLQFNTCEHSMMTVLVSGST
ncbi:hypothetical protein L915_09282 [Phytophthora nicotianae]|uniref:Uncharacterized protein n=1 Tax=Phytophthora nicotianae TaxID=4792 RepID=W2J122_PHYNI|nr:hypothetical protein L915_09282 [Phytophthora nicotianae]ETL39492.1 hypothetical protein L916_09187 [Phytophthora nicotianae]